MNATKRRVEKLKEMHLVTGNTFAMIPIEDLTTLFLYIEQLERKIKPPWEVASGL